MTLEAMCTKDSVHVITESVTTDSNMGTVMTPAITAVLKCLVQIPSASESSQFERLGMRVTHNVYFSANPNLNQGQRLQWGNKALRIVGLTEQGRPGEFFLWIANCEEYTAKTLVALTP